MRQATVHREVVALAKTPYVAAPTSYRIARRDDGSQPTHVERGQTVRRWSKAAHRQARWGTRA